MPSYKLDIHLPFFAMRTQKVHPKRMNIKPHREWVDLSFVAQVLPETANIDVLGLYPAQISFTICGTNNKQYIAYGFEDAEFDEDREFGEDEFSLDGFHADQMTKGEEDANRPIWDPREYYLLVLKHRVRQVREEWERVVLTLDGAFNMRVSHPPKWYRRLLEVLPIILPVLDDTLEMWETFLGPKGDYGYFSDSTAQSNASEFPKMLHNIDKEFEGLKKLHKILSRVQHQCEKEDTSRMMQQNNYIAVLMVQIIGPLSLVLSFFAIEKPFVEVKRSLVSFLGFNLVLILLVHLVRIFVEGHMYRPQWFGTIARKVKCIWKGNPDITNKTAAGGRALQRRQTFELYKKLT
jgi:hypothetical protein